MKANDAIAALLLLGAAAGLSMAQAGPSQAPSTAAAGKVGDSQDELALTVGKTVLVDCARPVARVALGAPEIAQVSAVSPTEVMVTGKGEGDTSLIIWDREGGRQFFNLRVRAAHDAATDLLDGVRRELRTELPDQPVKISVENGNIFLRGTVKDLNSAARVVRIASTAGKVVDLLNVAVPAADPQILLKVRFTAVDRNRSNQLGFNLFSNGLGNTLGGISTGQFSPPVVGSDGALSVTDPGNLFLFFPGVHVGATIKALEAKGVVEVLAEPNLLATNGKQASFLAGGEYPYPVVQGGSGGAGNSVTIMFKQYGVRLNFIPTITPRGTIHLQVAPEVSSLDYTNAIQLSGFNVPAISTRKVNTEIELAEGQSFVIGGLLDNRELETFQKIPFLGDIPILGRFFQSYSKNRTNTELIVIVTPEIVSPIPAGAAVPGLKFPEPFLKANSGTPMNTPDAKTAANMLPPAPATLPVEKLVDSMKPLPPLAIEESRGGFGASSTASQSAPANPAPPVLQP